MASCVPGELIPCAFVWHDPGITPCCKSLKTPGDNILVAANGALVYAKYGWRAPAQVYRKWDFGRKR